MTRSRRVGAILGCCLAASAVLVGPAWASRIFHETYHDAGSVEIENFCGYAGLTVRKDFVIDGKVRAVSRERDGFAYFVEQIRETELVTNLANGKTVTHVWTGNTKDLKVTDNGDGTLTILGLGGGNDVLYGSDGKAIARDPGQIKFEVVVDDGGTPADPFDDEVIDGSFIRETGRTDDFCAATPAALN